MPNTAFNLQESLKAHALAETIAEGALLVDDRGRLIYSNTQALKMLGFPPLRPDISVTDAIDNKEFSRALAEVLASEKSSSETVITLGGQDEGHPITGCFRVTSRRFFSKALNCAGSAIMIRDVSAEKERDAAREVFFQMMIHDMRTPLSSICGYTQLIKNRTGLPDDVSRCVRIVQHSSKRLSGMIEDALNIIKFNRGSMRLQPGLIDAGELCTGIFEVHEPLAARKNINFSIQPAPAKIEFHGDAALIERVIANLVDNSLKFTPHGGTVSVSFREAGGETLFCVEDNGPGIPEDKRHAIFEMYTQLEEHAHMGFGLGLSMCKMAVELHNGRIWAESEKGAGARFYFTIPPRAALENAGI